MIAVELGVLFSLWVAFYVYWIISAIRAKRNARSARSCTVYRVLAAVVILALLRFVRGFRRAVLFIPKPPLPLFGLVFCAVGLLLAVWARRHLGRNWGMPMSVKEDPELVTTGPYTYVRHPIYSGILLAMVGSAMADGPLWLIFAVVVGAFFVISAWSEERVMLRQFPEEYPAYRARTKAIVPFVW